MKRSFRVFSAMAYPRSGKRSTLNGLTDSKRDATGLAAEEEDAG
jgi:hypothetical protein